ncbi:MAG: hypothetical protein K2Y51_25970 [Gammaproteobacteria bacterium]|nr:hypothetical protein [Gammaproteobacteria bacterium]
MIWDIRAFGGLVPRVDPKMLPQAAAQVAVNCKLWNGVLQSLKKPKLIQVLTKPGAIQSIYRLPYLSVDYWLHWAADVNAVRGPVAGDTTKKLFYTGDGEPRVTHAELSAAKTDTIDGSNNYPGGYGEAVATDYPRGFYALGIHPPITSPLLGTPSGGTGTTETRAYVYTFADAWGWESAPSPPSGVQSGTPNGSWPLSGMDTAPLNTGSIIGATHASGVVTVYCSALHWLRQFHRVTLASVGGMTDLNGTRQVTAAVNRTSRTVSRARNANVATVVLESVSGLAVGQVVVVSGLGGAGYNGNVTLTGVNTTTRAITYASVGGNEGTTADTAGTVILAMFRVALTTVQVYTAGGTWTRVAPYNVTNMVKRIYRVLSGVNGQDYRFVDEIPVATTSYTDTKRPEQLGEILRTQDPDIVGSAWDMPPGDLVGIVSMPGGFFAAFREGTNELCFSEPFAPYAWPTRYRKTTDFPIVGLGNYGSTLSALTTAIPYSLNGFHPEALALERGKEVYPCVSKRSIVSGSAFGVLFATDRGLAMDAVGGTRLITEIFYDRESWQTGVDSDSMFSMEFEGRYYGFWPVSAEVGGAIIFDPSDVRGAISTNDFVVAGAWFDAETGLAYIVNDDGISQWDADDAYRQIFEWRSLKRVEPMPVQYKAAKVEFDPIVDAAESAAIAAANAAAEAANAAVIAGTPTGAMEVGDLFGEIGEAAIGDLAIGDDELTDMLSGELNRLTFELYGDGSLIYSTQVSASLPFRLPDGKDHGVHEIRMTGNVKVQSVQVAPTMSELAAR